MKCRAGAPALSSDSKFGSFPHSIAPVGSPPQGPFWAQGRISGGTEHAWVAREATGVHHLRI